MPEPRPHQTLAHPVGVLYEIRWSEICPWLILVKALRVTLLIRVLVLATIGVLLTQAGWGVLDQNFAQELAAPGRLSEELPLLDLQIRTEAVDSVIRLERRHSGTLVDGWYWLTEPFIRLGNQDVSWHGALGIALYGLWSVVVWGVFGGAICRITAIYLTRGETLGPLVAVRDAISVWPSTTGAPLIALLAALGLAVPPILLGTLLRLNLIAVLAGILWCFMLAWGLMLAVVLVGLLFGWPLMWACLGVERSDAFDGVSRCFAYVYQRPLHLVFFILVSALLGFLGEAVVAYFSAATIAISEWTVSWGMGGARTSELLTANWQDSASPLAARAIGMWNSTLGSIVASYPLACLWPMAVGIYLLLRRQVDATEMDEVALSDGTTEAGLPVLKAKDTGVPEVEQTSTNGDAPSSGD